MPAREDYVPLLGSERAPLPGARVTGSPGPDERIRVTVILRPNPSTEGEVEIDKLNALPPRERTYLTREQLETLRGASPEDASRVEAFASEHGLRVEDASLARRSVILSGTVAQVNEAFRIKLEHYTHSRGTYRGHMGPVYVPNELATPVQAVLGLDDRPQAGPRIRPAQEGGTSYTPTQVASLYDFPATSGGAAQSVGLIELGGGFELSDIQTYFSGLGIPAPKVISVAVDGASNSPTGDPNGPDGEVMLDIEVVGAVAPGTQIVVYFAPNTDQGFYDAVMQAIHDAKYSPSVISISWGGAESTWSTQGIQALNGAIQDASALGVTVCIASGDGGSSDGVTDGLAHVDFPASSPYALGCGGTTLQSSGATVITSEVVWNDQPKDGATGGGVSDVFPLPSWQADAGVPPSANPGARIGRGVPDVCGDADPATGYTTRVDGKDSVVGGTSAVAPLWAGLIALVNQKVGKPVGFINSVLYDDLSTSSGAFHDITSGNNGAYSAKQGWDACTGLGSPDGARLEARLLSSG
jgi:kumamolisin